jgi:hypothetical protein
VTTDLTLEGRHFLRETLSPFRQSRPKSQINSPQPQPDPADASYRPVSPMPGPNAAAPETATNQAAVPVDLPNDVAEKAVKELSRQPVSETEFWWLENLLRESTRKKR